MTEENLLVKSKVKEWFASQGLRTSATALDQMNSNLASEMKEIARRVKGSKKATVQDCHC